MAGDGAEKSSETVTQTSHKCSQCSKFIGKKPGLCIACAEKQASQALKIFKDCVNSLTFREGEANAQNSS
jgi:hypothetical protein